MVLLLGWWCHLCLEEERIAPLEIKNFLLTTPSNPHDVFMHKSSNSQPLVNERSSVLIRLVV
ncbi:hypothetical protein BDE02_06G051900 [Populus trichocarpa]|nr:hypothetical protein BDE02_06G051900 [Populus trichocarpa]